MFLTNPYLDLKFAVCNNAQFLVDIVNSLPPPVLLLHNKIVIIILLTQQGFMVGWSSLSCMCFVLKSMCDQTFGLVSFLCIVQVYPNANGYSIQLTHYYQRIAICHKLFCCIRNKTPIRNTIEIIVVDLVYESNRNRIIILML